MADALIVRSLDTGPDAVSAQVHCDGAAVDFSVRVEGASFGEQPDFLLPATLLPAMRKGAAIELPAGVSPTLLTSLPELQSIFSLWSEAYRKVPVRTSPREPSEARGRGTLCFFSGGVDTWYTVLEHLDEIDALVFVDGGFHKRGWTEVTENARAAVRELGKPLVEVDTDLRRLATIAGAEVPFYLYGGPMVAAVALLLQDTFDRALIASTFSYAALRNYGSHPLVDPLWSTESIRLVHHGNDATRPMKVARLAQSDVAMRRLQACNRGGRESDGAAGYLNCGRCRKCVRTMANLRAVGALDRCQTFPDEVDLEQVAALPVDDDRDLAYTLENLRAAEQSGDRELIAALRTSLESGRLGEAGVVDLLAMKRRLAKTEKQVRQMQASLSWRLTAPLRALAARRRR